MKQVELVYKGSTRSSDLAATMPANGAIRWFMKGAVSTAVVIGGVLLYLNIPEEEPTGRGRKPDAEVKVGVGKPSTGPNIEPSEVVPPPNTSLRSFAPMGTPTTDPSAEPATTASDSSSSNQ